MLLMTTDSNKRAPRPDIHVTVISESQVHGAP